jgi:hypothetical protein
MVPPGAQGWDVRQSLLGVEQAQGLGGMALDYPRTPRHQERLAGRPIDKQVPVDARHYLLCRNQRSVMDNKDNGLTHRYPSQFKSAVLPDLAVGLPLFVQYRDDFHPHVGPNRIHLTDETARRDIRNIETDTYGNQRLQNRESLLVVLKARAPHSQDVPSIGHAGSEKLPKLNVNLRLRAPLNELDSGIRHGLEVWVAQNLNAH